MEFADPEDAKSALVAQGVSLRLGDDAPAPNDNIVVVKITKEYVPSNFHCYYLRL